MNSLKNVGTLLENTVERLTSVNSEVHEFIRHQGKILPSIPKLRQIVDIIRSIVFPGFFGSSVVRPISLIHYTGRNLEQLYELLGEQIHSGFCFEEEEDSIDLKNSAYKHALSFIDSLPEIRRLLATDVKAMYDADPAAKNFEEIIFCYPTIRTMINYRIAHRLLKLGVPLIPRIISEMAHSETGIDIHPGAEIGEYFCIDHGTGVVIGETCIIGDNVRLYQGVTLGAKKFTLDEYGNPIKDEPRHPILEDNVVIYSNATILGRITIGRNSVIGGNVWITSSVPPYSKLTQAKLVDGSFDGGLGI
jgi:serine O-acetyltransferase